MDDIEYVDAPEDETHVDTMRNSPQRSRSVTPSLEKKLTETIPSRQARIDDDEESEDEDDDEDDMEVIGETKKDPATGKKNPILQKPTPGDKPWSRQTPAQFGVHWREGVEKLAY